MKNMRCNNLKKVYLLGIIILLLISSIYTMLPIKEKKIKEELQRINQLITDASTQWTDFPPITEGKLTGTINYKGSHKEPYKIPISYFFKVDDNSDITIWDESGSHNILWNQEYIGILKKLRNSQKIENILEIEQINQGIITLNQEKINNILNTSFHKCMAKIETNTIWKNITKTTLQFDETIITIQKNIIEIVTPKDKITLNQTQNGWLISINEQTKIQTEIRENQNTYHIIMNNNVFLLKKTKDNLKIISSTPIENYHSMEINLTQNTITDKISKELEIDYFPILKYLQALNVIKETKNEK